MNYTNTHRDIVERCKQNERKAQSELYHQYAKAMYNICLRMLNGVSDAEDVLQNSFIDVFSKLHYFRYESSIGAWIKRIVVNNCINHLKKKRISFVAMDDVAHAMAAEGGGTARESSMEYSVQKINRAMKELATGHRVVLNLYLFEGYDHVEIGEILGISTSTSKSQYSRAKKKLKSIMEG